MQPTNSLKSTSINKNDLEDSEEEVFVFPTSFAQQRLWFLDQFEPGNPLYNIPMSYRLSGRLNRAALEQSLNEIIRRHEILRTTFIFAGNQPVQLISPDLFLPLAVVDLRQLPISARELKVQNHLEQEYRWKFNLARGPLLRATLLQLRETEHIFILVVHHIIADGWSAGILFKKLETFYTAFCTGKAATPAELPIQYADFSVWQRQWLQGEVLEAQLAYWKETLAGVPPKLELPTDQIRPAVQTFSGRNVSIVLSEQLTSALNDLSRHESVTLFMTLLAAFKILLHRYTGQTDIVVGAPIAGRRWLEIEGLIGFFLNSLVLRTDLSGELSFQQLINRVREVTLGAYAHQDIPFEKLLEELHPERNLSQTPLFQVFFNMLTLPGTGLKLSGLSVEPLRYSEASSKFDLTVYIEERDNCLYITWRYNVGLFSEKRMSKIVEQYEYLLHQIVQNPKASISHYSLVTPSAKALLVNPAQPLQNEWKGSVHSHFSLQASQFPDQLAIIDPFDSWSYQELELRSNQLAHYLRANGIQDQDVIAVYGHRSASLVWALLGILKAGAAFTIFDPAHPVPRLIYCLQAVKPKGWLQLKAAEPLPDDLQAAVTALPDCWYQVLPARAVAEQTDLFKEYPTTVPQITVAQDDLAYIAFTSGSTGQPKGVLGRHGPLSHFLPWQTETFGLSSSDRFSMLSGLSHDPLQRDIFTALWVGATICIPHPEFIGVPGHLADWMEQQNISFTHLTPPMCQLLLDNVSSDRRLSSLRYAFFVGDKLTQHDVTRLQDIAPTIICINSYGTTETQRAVGYHIIPPKQETVANQGKAVYHLGHGMPDVQLLILNSEHQLASFNELGEIYVRSPHLAGGYLNDHQLTQDRFLTNPFTGEASDRLYRTGDLGRYLPDGNVEFAGRADWQVKIRGYRVELGEIEAVLNQHPDVKDSIVLNRENEPENPYLVAYVIANQKTEPTAAELRSYLREKLPDYMVPTYYEMLDSFPLTPSGKMDYKTLPEPGLSRPELDNSYVAPRNPSEQVLVDIWSRILNIEQVGIHDNFFDLGGHSLLATQVVSHIRDALQIELPLRELLKSPTVAGLSPYIQIAQWASQDKKIIRKLPDDQEEFEF